MASLINAHSSKTHGVPRSPQWPSVRAKFLKSHPSCACCGRTEKLEAHHIVPFHQDMSKELNPTNLIALCEGYKQINCHLICGHGGNFQDVNPDSPKDAAHILWLIKNRQLGAKQKP